MLIQISIIILTLTIRSTIFLDRLDLQKQKQA
jgi:hypothetical protein